MDARHAAAPALLVTAAASPFAELARWALDLAGIPFREEPHLPILQTPATFLRGGGVGAMSLVLPGGRTVDEAVDVVRVADERLGGRLLGRDRPPATRRAILELEARFLNVLGPHARRLFYGHVLPDRDLVCDTLARDVPALERAAFRRGHAVVLRLLRARLGLAPEALLRSEERVRELFEATEQRVADRAFLVEDRVSAADLALGALASPVLLPDGMGGPRVPLERLPRTFRALVESLRETRTGGFVSSLYTRVRHPGREEPS